MKNISQVEIELQSWIDELGLSAMEALPIKIQFATGFYLIRNVKDLAQNKNYAPNKEAPERRIDT